MRLVKRRCKRTFWLDWTRRWDQHVIPEGYRNALVDDGLEKRQSGSSLLPCRARLGRTATKYIVDLISFINRTIDMKRSVASQNSAKDHWAVPKKPREASPVGQATRCLIGGNSVGRYPTIRIISKVAPLVAGGDWSVGLPARTLSPSKPFARQSVRLRKSRFLERRLFGPLWPLRRRRKTRDCLTIRVLLGALGGRRGSPLLRLAQNPPTA